MISFFGGSKSAYEKRLEKEAVLLRNNAECIYWEELAKPEDERDKQLMEECLSVIKQSSGILLGGKQYHRPERLYGLKRVAVACAVILAVAAAAGVVYAGGAALWNIIFKADNQGIVIDGRTNEEVKSEEHIDFDAVPEYNMQPTRSVEEGKKLLGINCLNFDLTKQGYMIDNIYITKNDVFMELDVRYTDGDKYVEETVQVYNGGANTAYITELLGSFDSTETREIADRDVYIGTGSNANAIGWADGEYIYQFYTNEDAEVLLECIEAELHKN